jgi:hypothetical protein
MIGMHDALAMRWSECKKQLEAERAKSARLDEMLDRAIARIVGTSVAGDCMECPCHIFGYDLSNCQSVYMNLFMDHKRCSKQIRAWLEAQIEESSNKTS